MRGSSSSTSASDSTSRTDSFTRRIRLVNPDHLALHTHHLELLPVQIPLGVVEQPRGLTVLAGHARERDPGALPQIVVVHLGDGRAEPVLQLRLHGLDELPLPLQRTRLGEVQLDRQDPDVTRAHGAYDIVTTRVRERPSR